MIVKIYGTITKVSKIYEGEDGCKMLNFTLKDRFNVPYNIRAVEHKEFLQNFNLGDYVEVQVSLRAIVSNTMIRYHHNCLTLKTIKMIERAATEAKYTTYVTGPTDIDSIFAPKEEEKEKEPKKTTLDDIPF